MSYARLAARLYNAPLLITPGKAEVIEGVFRSYSEGKITEFKAPERVDLASPLGPRTQAGYVRTSDGIAIIQVLGSLMQRSGGLDALSNIESYQRIGAQLDAAIHDPTVRGILLEIDSPGGEAAGVFDLASEIKAASDVKPLIAHANEMAFSAAYALGSAAGQLYVARTGMVGSVGVVMLHVDQSTRNAKAGLVVTPIYAGSKKVDFSQHAPLSDEARATAQTQIDRLYDVFVTHVAQARGIDPQAVRDTEAALMAPDDATAIGMADGTASFAESLQMLKDQIHAAGGRPPTYNRSQSAAALEKEQHAMNDKEMQDAITKARAEGKAEGKSEGETAAAARVAAEFASSLPEKEKAAAKAAETATQARIAGILGHAEAKGREDLAKHLAFKTASSVDDAAALLTAAPKGSAAGGLRSQLTNTNPKVGADGGAPDPGKVVTIDRSAIYGARAKACRR